MGRTLRGRHKGREKVRKYGATYTFVKQSPISVPEGEDESGEETCTVGREMGGKWAIGVINQSTH